jgi:hypothetical protein
VISEFYTPLVPKGYDFLDSISKLEKMNDWVIFNTDFILQVTYNTFI